MYLVSYPELIKTVNFLRKSYCNFFYLQALLGSMKTILLGHSLEYIVGGLPPVIIKLVSDRHGAIFQQQIHIFPRVWIFPWLNG